MSRFKVCAALVLTAVCATPVGAAEEAESMFNEETYRSLVAEGKAYRVGDVLTVVIQEAASASSTVDAKAQRNTALNAQVGSSKTGLHSVSAGAGTETDGGGRTNRSGKLLAQISVRVLEVTANGDLVVQGQQNLKINDEEQIIMLSGLVRQRDISDNNTVSSTRIAEARVRFIGEGFATDKSQPGFVSWFLSLIGF